MVDHLSAEASEYFKRAVAEPRMKTLGEQMLEAFGSDLQWTPEQVAAMRRGAPVPQPPINTIWRKSDGQIVS